MQRSLEYDFLEQCYEYHGLLKWQKPMKKSTTAGHLMRMAGLEHKDKGEERQKDGQDYGKSNIW